MIVFDTETTGLLSPSETDLDLQPCITEIMMVKIDRDFNFIGELETLLKPKFPIPDKLEQLTGITNAMVSEAPEFVEAYDDICDFVLGEDIFVAHNASFDVGMLRVELQRLGLQFNFPWPKHHICTIEKSYCINNYRLNLAKLHLAMTGKPLEGWHRAKDDVYGLIRSFEGLVKKGYINLDDYK